MGGSEEAMEKITAIVSSIQNIFDYDPQMIFTDTFEAILQQINLASDVITTTNADEHNYWIVYNMVIEIIPVIERLIFTGYSDLILEFLLSTYHTISENILFNTSRFIPLRMQMFIIICSAMANTQDSRYKDAENFINTFKADLTLLRQLEESNMNGLSDEIITCNNEKIKLEDLFSSCFKTIELIHVHFSTSEEIDYDTRSGVKEKSKSKGRKAAKEEPIPHVAPIPNERTVDMIINAFGSPVSKQDYLNKYSQITQAWTNPECTLDISLLHRLMYCFIRAGTISDIEQLSTALPDDPIVKIAVSLQSKDYIEISRVLTQLPKEKLSQDFQFYNSIAMKLWSEYASGKVNEIDVLCGVLHVLVSIPSPCPMQTALAALHLCWHYLDTERYSECIECSATALEVINKFRDVFATRKTEKVVPSHSPIPSKPVDNSFILFSNWLECLHVDLLTVWIQSQLKNGLTLDTETKRIQHEESLKQAQVDMEKTKQLYGTLSANQKADFEAKLNKPFKPPQHSETVETKLLDQFHDSLGIKALIYIQMSFFRPSKSSEFLEKARQCLVDLQKLQDFSTSPVIFVNRNQVTLLCQDTSDAHTVALYGKELKNNSGLTLSNTALKGCGVKQDAVEPFIVTNLKPNLMYTFAFAKFDAQGDIVDGLGKPFVVGTFHTLSNDLIWSYVAAAAYKTKDMASFDVALAYLLQKYALVYEAPEENAFAANTNPYNRFLLNPAVLNEPAPLLRSLSTVLLMAARLFSNKPLHASSFQHLSLVITQILNNKELILKVCIEMYTTIQPCITKPFHTRWVVHPLLSIINALKPLKDTANEEIQQIILTKCAYALSSAFMTLYQEKQLSQFIISTVAELPAGEWRNSFMMFAAKNQLLESSIGAEQVLPLYAADLFRSSPDRSFDELFSKFKLDPNFGCGAVYLASAAQNNGMFNQVINWTLTSLEHMKGLLHETEDRPASKKASGKASAKSVKKKPPPSKGKSKDQSKQNLEEQAMHAAATKLQTVWTKVKNRKKNIEKYYKANKDRCALKLLNAMALMESDPVLVQSTNQNENTSRKEKHTSAKNSRQSKHPPKKTQEESSQNNDPSTAIVDTLTQSIILGLRSDSPIVVKSASQYLLAYLCSLTQGTPTYSSILAIAPTMATRFTTYLPLNEKWARDLLEMVYLMLVRDGRQNIVITLLTEAVSYSFQCASMVWMVHDCELNADIKKALTMLQRRDPAENAYYVGSDILNRCRPENTGVFPNEPCFTDLALLNKTVGDIAVSLQHKQKLSMSVSLLKRIAFALIEGGDTQTGVKKLCEALECHFRTVHVHEKVDQILESETEESFYEKYSWSGCISIFVLCSYIAMYSERAQAMQMCRLGAFAIGALFANHYMNPKKQIDFINFEPCEIVPGVQILSDSDPAQPLLDPPSPELVGNAINNLLISMSSYEMYFEMFKPLAFARHYARFIVRERRGLARFRLMTASNCCHFGLISQAIRILDDVITNFGIPRITKESILYPHNAKRFPYNQSEPPTHPPNMDCIKHIASSQSISAVANNAGALISLQYVMTVAKILGVVYVATDPTVKEEEPVTNKKETASSRAKHRKSHGNTGHGKKGEDLSQVMQSIGNETLDMLVRTSEQLLNDSLNREFFGEQQTVKLEIRLELANLKMRIWHWNDALQIAADVRKAVSEMKQQKQTLVTNYVEKATLLPVGLTIRATQIISQCAYNLHDFKMADRYASKYLKAILHIHKAEMENAAMILSQIVLNEPITAFHQEYVNSCGQLVVLCCQQPRIMDNIYAALKPEERAKLEPLSLAMRICDNTKKFFVNELGMYNQKNMYLLNTYLLIRLQHLKVIASTSFKGQINAVKELESALQEMTNVCPFISPGLEFLISSTSLRIRVQEFLKAHPAVIQFWNKEINPLTVSNTAHFAPEEVDEMTTAMQHMFAQHPECIVHPSSQQSILDYVILAGIASNEDGERLNRSFAALTVTSVVRSARRFIQSLVASSPESAPVTCPQLLLNDNKDATQRGLAAAYFAHVCSLDLPMFNTEIAEKRTALFFKAFEEQCAHFKALSQLTPPALEPGQIVGQWYPVDSKIFKGTLEMNSDNVSRSGRTATQATTISNSSRATTSSGIRRTALLKGSLFFFTGVVCDPSDSSLKPVMYAGQFADLKSISAEMAEIGIEIDEAHNMDKSTAETVVVKEVEKSSKKKGPPKLPSTGTKAVEPSANLLKNQAALALKSADLKWGVSMHKAESIFNKSLRIIGSIGDSRNRWPTEVKLAGVEKESAAALSSLFNIQFGICRKDESLAKWMVTAPEQQTSARHQPTSLPLLK